MISGKELLPDASEGGLKRLRIVFGGRCQGVGFRFTAESIATRLNLAGWVKNEIGGTVLMEIQGSAAGIHRFINHLDYSFARWNVGIRIESVESIKPVPGDRTFNIRYY